MSARNQRRANIEAEIRRTYALGQHEVELSRSIRKDEVLIELQEPIRAGWERYFIVRPDLVHTAEGKTLAKLLPHVQREETSHRRDFAVRDWERGGKKYPVPHTLMMLSETYFYERLPEDLRPHFTLVFDRDRRGNKRVWFALCSPWKFVSRVRPYYYTHRALPNSEAEGELQHVRSLLYGPLEWGFRHRLRAIGANRMWSGPRHEIAPLVLPDEIP